jgi:hypothetical protein
MEIHFFSPQWIDRGLAITVQCHPSFEFSANILGKDSVLANRRNSSGSFLSFNRIRSLFARETIMQPSFF